MMSNTKLYTIFESKNDTSKVETRIMYIRVDYKRKFLLNIETQKFNLKIHVTKYLQLKKQM